MIDSRGRFRYPATRSNYGCKGRSTTMEKLTIGQVASSAGINLETIRYYERIGLLPEPGRT